jgi:hypothetical protein
MNAMTKNLKAIIRFFLGKVPPLKITATELMVSLNITLLDFLFFGRTGLSEERGVNGCRRAAKLPELPCKLNWDLDRRVNEANEDTLGLRIRLVREPFDFSKDCKSAAERTFLGISGYDKAS